MTKPHFFFILSCLTFIFFVNSNAQSMENDPRITVEATGEVQVPADLIHFQVNITQFRDDAREAFELHKEQEEFLTELLLEEEISDSNITANPISISHVRRHTNTGESGYETRQQVLIELDDVTQFESMQIKLIENGFVNFSGSFSSTQLAEASDKALGNAVSQAKRKAEILAEAAGKKITEIIEITYHSGRTYSARSNRVEMAYDSDGGSLLQFERIIPVTENVSVQFRIE